VVYFDTSFLSPLVLPESTSGAIMAFVRGLSVKEQTVSHWTRVEFSSLVARKVRMGELDAGGGARADARFEAMVEEFFAVVLPNAADFDLAKQYLARFETRLRSWDALHLAIASNRRAVAIFSLDRTMIKAGSILDLPVSGL
jgi:uncharacterized protein